MAIEKKGKFYYSDSQSDIKVELERFSELNGYVSTHFADSVCNCSKRTFNLLIDENEGAAVRRCVSCNFEYPIGDSGEYLEDAELEECECPCGSDVFELTIGLALYLDSEDVRWLYVGCRCPNCGLTATYGDWKNEFIGFRELLSRV